MKMIEFFAHPGRWTRGDWGRTKSGQALRPRTGPLGITNICTYEDLATVPVEDIQCACLRGALYICYPKLDERMEAQHRLVEAGAPADMVPYNDAPERTFEEILDLIQRANV